MFFEKQGIKDVVDKMEALGKIDPEQRGLWGMIYWESLQTEHGLIVFGPEEIRQAVAAEDSNNKAYTEEVDIDGHRLSWFFGINQSMYLNPENRKLSPFGVEVPVTLGPFKSPVFWLGWGR